MIDRGTARSEKCRTVRLRDASSRNARARRAISSSGSGRQSSGSKPASVMSSSAGRAGGSRPRGAAPQRLIRSRQAGNRLSGKSGGDLYSAGGIRLTELLPPSRREAMEPAPKRRQPPTDRRTRLIGYVAAVGAGALWGTTGPLSTALYAEGAALTGVGFWRVAVATAGLLAVGLVRRDLLRVDRRGLLAVGLGGGAWSRCSRSPTSTPSPAPAWQARPRFCTRRR